MYWIELLWYFIIISFLGWLFSGLYHYISEKKFYNEGFLTLPFCPAYGAGALICWLLLSPLTNNFFILFVGSALILSFFTLLAGVLGKKILGCKPWDFSSMRFNLGSYLTMPFVLVLGFSGAFSVKMLIPLIKTLIDQIPDLISMIISLSIALLILIDYVFSFITIYRLKKRITAAKYDPNFINDNVSE